MFEYLIILLRIVTVMLLLLFATLYIMGKRPIGELPVFDFLVLVVMGSVVGADIADPEIRHLPTAFAIIILALFQRLVAVLILRSRVIRKIATFEPTIILRNGKLIYKNIRSIRYVLDDILMLLREKDVFDITQVEYAIVESNGKMSVLKKKDFDSVTPNDLRLIVEEVDIPLTVIQDGCFKNENIGILKTSEAEITEKLYDLGYPPYTEIFYGAMNQQGVLIVSPYDVPPG